MVMNRRWWAAACAVGAFGLAGLLVACSSSVAPTAKPKVPSFTTATTATSSASANAVPKDCTSFAVAADVDQIVGHQLSGAMNQVVGIAEPSISRLSRLDCYYGWQQGQPLSAAAVTIGLAAYTDASAAQHRAALTVNSARNSGATTSDVLVGKNQAVLIVTQNGQELVMSKGNETVLVTAATGVLAQGQASGQLVALAKKALSAS
jgi:hypothetical protein